MMSSHRFSPTIDRKRDRRRSRSRSRSPLYRRGSSSDRSSRRRRDSSPDDRFKARHEWSPERHRYRRERSPPRHQHHQHRGYRRETTPERYHGGRYDYGLRGSKHDRKMHPDIQAHRNTRRVNPYQASRFARSMPERNPDKFEPPRMVAFFESRHKDVPVQKIVDVAEIPTSLPKCQKADLMVNVIPLEVGYHPLFSVNTIKIIGVTSRGKEDEITADIRDSIHRNMRMEALQVLVAEIFAKKREIFRDPLYVYDRLGVFYTTEPLKEHFHQFEFVAEDFQLAPSAQQYLHRYIKYEVEIRHVDYINPTNPASLVEATKYEKFLELLTSQYPILSQKFLWYGNKFYCKDPLVKLPNGLVVREGYDKKIFVLADDKAYGSNVLLQFNVLRSVFFEKASILRFLDEMGFKHDQLKDPQHWEELESNLRFVVAETTHLDYTRRFPVVAVSKQSAKHQLFHYKEKEDEEADERLISVADYFLERRNIKLEFPDYPCLVDSSGAYFPLEVLMITDGQIIPESKLKCEVARNACKIKPAERFHKIREALYSEDILGFAARNQYLKEVHVHASRRPKFLKISSDFIFKPSIVYQHELLSLNYSCWTDAEQQFLEPAVISKLAIIEYGLTRKEADDFVRQFQHEAKKHGMKLGLVRIFSVSNIDKYQLQELCEKLAAREFTASIILADSRKFHDAADFAKFERLGPVQHLHYRQDGREVDLMRAVRTMNVLLGGTNFGIATDSQFADELNGINFLHSFLRTTLLVGTSISLGQSYSVVGYASTFNSRASRYNTEFSLQKGKDCFVDPDYLGAKIVQSMQSFREGTGAFPKQVIIFRSEVFGQDDDEVETKEIKPAKDVISKLCKEFEIPFPKIAVIGIGRDSCYSFIPYHSQVNDFLKAPTRINNVNAATIVTGHGFNRHKKEFIFFARRINYDTAKPVVGTIMAEYPKTWTNVNHMAHLSTSLCYLNQKVTGACRSPQIVYAADDVAARGKLLYNRYQQNRGKVALEDALNGATANNLEEILSL